MTCRKCGRRMRPQRTRNDGRPTHHARGLCATCYNAERRAGTLDRYDDTRVVWRPDPVAMIEDVEWMRDTGEHPLRWAPRLGTNHNALSRRLYRVGRNDLALEVDRAVRYNERSAA